MSFTTSIRSSATFPWPQAELLVTYCRLFLDEAGELGHISARSLEQFGRRFDRPSRTITQNAAVEAVALLDDALTECEAKVDAVDHWSELYCVVCSGHQPRYGELNKQLFRQYLKSRNIGDVHWEHRLLYAEGVEEPKAALRLVAQRRVDARLGSVFMGSSTRLNQDILAHAATMALARQSPM